MRASMVTVVAVMVVTLGFWLGQAEAQHGRGAAPPPAPHLPKVAPRPPAVKPLPPHPKAKARQKSKGAAAKPPQKKPKQHDSAQAKDDPKKSDPHKKQEKAARERDDDARKKQIAKEKARERDKRALADHEAIALLRSAHQKLHEADHDYDGHRHRATEHVRGALGHLGSSAETPIRAGGARANLPQSVSDAVMREARSSLETIKNQLASGIHAGAGHGKAQGAGNVRHEEARAAVDAAIREIDLALRVR
jgi:type IV secretory pathway VirB10-like protein